MSSRAAVTRAELEISTYGPDYLVENARKPVSLPLLSVLTVSSISKYVPHTCGRLQYTCCNDTSTMSSEA
jgi:hypothetical protein